MQIASVLGTVPDVGVERLWGSTGNRVSGSPKKAFGAVCCCAPCVLDQASNIIPVVFA